MDGLHEQLPAEDHSADAVVTSLVLCSVVRRVLKPGGQLRFLEHVRADTPGLARVQHILDATIWPRLAGGCHTGRDTATAVERSGFRQRTHRSGQLRGAVGLPAGRAIHRRHIGAAQVTTDRPILRWHIYHKGAACPVTCIRCSRRLRQLVALTHRSLRERGLVRRRQPRQ